MKVAEQNIGLLKVPLIHLAWQPPISPKEMEEAALKKVGVGAGSRGDRPCQRMSHIDVHVIAVCIKFTVQL